MKILQCTWLWVIWGDNKKKCGSIIDHHLTTEVRLDFNQVKYLSIEKVSHCLVNFLVLKILKLLLICFLNPILYEFCFFWRLFVIWFRWKWRVVSLSLNIQQNTIYHHTWLKKDYIDLKKQSSRGVLEKRCF